MDSFEKRPISIKDQFPSNISEIIMSKVFPSIAGALLGLIFISLSLMVLLHLVHMPPPPPGTPPALFFGALVPTGYFTFIKFLELTGGILVAIPKTRNFGLLVLGPIIVNILAFHIFLAHGAGLTQPPVIAVTLLSLYLLWSGRSAFAGLLRQ
jgi:hypothetical protein